MLVPVFGRNIAEHEQGLHADRRLIAAGKLLDQRIFPLLQNRRVSGKRKWLWADDLI